MLFNSALSAFALSTTSFIVATILFLQVLNELLHVQPLDFRNVCQRVRIHNAACEVHLLLCRFVRRSNQLSLSCFQLFFGFRDIFSRVLSNLSAEALAVDERGTTSLSTVCSDNGISSRT